MPTTSKELLDQVDRPSILDGLLLSCKDPTSQIQDEHRTYVNSKEMPSFAPLPKSQALGRARDFLEVIAKANKDLEIKAKEDPRSNYDIEVLNDDANEYIEMDLLLGVADLHNEDAVAAAEASISGFQRTVICNEEEDVDSGDDFNENECIEDKMWPTGVDADHNKSPMKVKPNKRPKVVMLD